MENKFNESISEENGLKTINCDHSRILSVGVSTGGIAEIRMIEKNPDAYVIATTIDEKGLEFSKNIIKEKGFEDKIELRIEDVSKPMSYSDEYFDFIYARLVLHYLDRNQLKNALKELRRVLRNNGNIYIVVRSTKDVAVSLPDSVYYPENGMTKHADYRTIGTSNVKYVYRSFYSEESIREYLKEAGFYIEYVKEYEEQLYSDYERKELALKPAHLLEVLARK